MQNKITIETKGATHSGERLSEFPAFLLRQTQMQMLVNMITRELEKQEHFAVYQPELDRVWPQRQDREQEVMRFAQKHGWRLRFYKEGLVAIFDKDPSQRKILRDI